MISVKNLKLLRISIILIAVGLLVFLILYSRNTLVKANGFLQGARISAYSKLSFIGSFISEVGGINTLTRENLKLREENQDLLARLAFQEDLKGQNERMREAMGLPAISGRNLLDAGVFNLGSDPGGHHLLINKGAKDSLKKDDVVISASGVLIGIVDEPFENYSRINTVMSIVFKATIKVLSKDISGIAKGAVENGIYLDFISQNDEISEGDTIVTSGNDIFPAGLIIGKVSRVSADSGSLFKTVIVEPAFNDINLGRVLVILK